MEKFKDKKQKEIYNIYYIIKEVVGYFVKKEREPEILKRIYIYT